MATDKPRTCIARLCNRAGTLDSISADGMRTLARELGKRLIAQDWILADGDIIHIERQTTND